MIIERKRESDTRLIFDFGRQFSNTSTSINSSQAIKKTSCCNTEVLTALAQLHANDFPKYVPVQRPKSGSLAMQSSNSCSIFELAGELNRDSQVHSKRQVEQFAANVNFHRKQPSSVDDSRRSL